MEQKDKNFEDNLHEILSSGPDKRVNRPKEPTKAKSEPESKKQKSFSSSAEILFRIIAALAALGLLILFGFQAAQR